MHSIDSFHRLGHYRRFKARSRTTLVIFASICIVGIFVLSQMYQFEIFKENQDFTIQGNVFTDKTENITLVTAYFDLGSFRKGERLNFTQERYFNWAKAYKYIVNPLVVFTDTDEFVELVKTFRCDLARKTEIIKIERKSLWPFHLIDEIAAVYSQPHYPKFYPNTVRPDYSATQHAKYAAVAYAIKNKYLENDFYAWIDIGYFRDVIGMKKYSRLLLPSGFDSRKIAVNQVDEKDEDLTPVSIFKDNEVWVGGGMFIGTPQVLLEFENIYKRSVDYFLKNKLMNTDQQIIYSLYSEEGRKALHPSIELQIYEPPINYSEDEWFYLGYLCRTVLPSFIMPSKKKCNFDEEYYSKNVDTTTDSIT